MRNVVITGGSKGIGKAIAIKLAQNKYNVIVCSRNGNEAEEVARELMAVEPLGKYAGFACDVTNKNDLSKFVEDINAFYDGKVDVLVNNAGVFIPGSVSTEEPGNLELMVETNLYSAYYLTRAILGGMKERKSGHVINMCSIASQIAYPNGGSYSISKFALLGFSKVLREEMKAYNVKVSAIMPGATWSDSWNGVDLPESRLMQADDIAKIVLCALELSGSATLEEIIVRPQLGDL